MGIHLESQVELGDGERMGKCEWTWEMSTESIFCGQVILLCLGATI